MQQISNYIFCDDFISSLQLESRLMPNQYYDYPYLIIKNFLDDSTCKEITDYTFSATESEHAKLKVKATRGEVEPKYNENIRKTMIHALPKALQNIYDITLQEHKVQIEDYFNLPLSSSTKTQVLEYTQGSFYTKHADDSSELVNEKKETVGFKQVAPQRKLTSILFVTSHAKYTTSGRKFNGGELIFNYLFDSDGNQIKIYPQAGDIIIFPSNPIYSHEVAMVSDGYRLSIAQWHDGIVV